MKNNNGKSNNGIFLIFLFFLSFVVAVLIATLTHYLLSKISAIWISLLLLLTIIIVGIAFDIIGIAATAANEVPFHAKAAKRVFGSSQAIKLIRNADKVAIFAIDVVGDISGPISGALGAAIVIQILTSQHSGEQVLLETLMTAVVAAMTVTGKAFGKSYAIREANSIIFKVGKLWAALEKPMAFFGIQKARKKGK